MTIKPNENLGMRAVEDQLGRIVLVPRKPRRIVSLVPSQTELLFDLGVDGNIAGITRYCVHPAEQVSRKTVVGGTRRLDIGAIDRLGPDLIIANKEENDRTTMLDLAERYPVWVSNIMDLSDALAMIRAVGALVARADAGIRLARLIERDFRTLAPVRAPLRVAYLIWRKPFRVAGNFTFIGDMMTRCGFVNVFPGDEQNRYPETPIGSLQTASLDAVLLSSEPYPFDTAHRNDLAAHLPGVAIHLVDGQMFSWYGSRLLQTPEYFRRVIAEIGRPQP